MLCCVIGGALGAFFFARLSRLPIVGPHLRRLQRPISDPSEWRLVRPGERT